MANASVSRKLSSISGVNNVWAKLLPDAKRRIFARGSVLDVARDITIQGHPGFYYIVSGLIRLSYIGLAGEERTILYAGPGVLLNVPTLLANDSDDTLATCVETTEIAIFDAALLHDVEFARNNPELMLNLVHTLCSHLVIHSQRLADAALENTISRLCRIIRELAPGRTSANPNITQQELALLLGIHRATLTRSLSRLRRMGVIGKFTKKELEVLNPALLEELAGSRS